MITIELYKDNVLIAQIHEPAVECQTNSFVGLRIKTKNMDIETICPTSNSNNIVETLRSIDPKANVLISIDLDTGYCKLQPKTNITTNTKKITKSAADAKLATYK